MINIANTSRAYSEVYEFINTLEDEYKSKVPRKIYLIIQDNRDKNYVPKYDKNQNVDNNTFSKEAIALISALNLQYWCNDVREKERLKKVYLKNSKIEQEKYSYDNLFKSNKIEEKVVETQENVNIIEYKSENIFQKIFNIIKNLFSKFK